MKRRDFFLNLGLTSAAIVLGPEVWEFLNHKKIFALGAIPVRVVMKSYAMEYRITKEMIEDDLYKTAMFPFRYDMAPERFRELITQAPWDFATGTKTIPLTSS